MSLIIKQSTAIVVAIGPFVDQADGYTPETSLTLTQPDIRLSKNGAAFAQKSAAQTLTHMENGYYSLDLSATDTNTVGSLVLHVYESGALPVFLEFQVVEEVIYDALFGASATGALPVSTGGIVAGSFGAGAIDAAAIATGAIDADAIADNAIDAGAIAADAITAAKVASDVSDEITVTVLAALKEQDRRGTAVSAGSGSNTMVIAAGDQKADDFYNGAIVVLLEGTGTTSLTPAERTRKITDYVNSTNQITVDENWASAVAAGTRYLIIGG